MSIDQFLLSADTTDLNYPEIRPTLDLNFARVKALDPRIDFTRASGGSYVGADGLIKYAGVNEARFDHDPETGESLGLLIEESRTNFISNNTMQGAVVGTPGTLPSGWSISDAGLNWSVIDIGIENGINYIDFNIFGYSNGSIFSIFFTPFSSIVASVGQTWTHSLWVSKISGTFDNISNFGLGFQERTLASGNIRSGVGTLIDSDDESKKLKRYIHTRTLSESQTERYLVNLRFSAISNTQYINITLRLGMPQLELGSFSTSIIPTQASSRTRTGDRTQITGKNFSDFYNQNEGTIFFSGITQQNAVAGAQIRRFVELHESTTGGNNLIVIGKGFTSTQARILYRNNGVNLNPPNGQTLNNIFPFARIATGIKSGDYAFSGNGSPVVKSSATPLPIVDTMTIGTRSDFAAFDTINGTISRLTYYPKRLPDSQLQALTR